VWYHPQLFPFALTGNGVNSSTMLSSLTYPTHTFNVFSGTYTLNEQPMPPLWYPVSANCVSDKGNPDQDPTAGPIVLDPAETLWCKYINQADRELAVTLASISASGKFNVLVVLALGLVAVAAASGGLIWRRARVRQG
jgi:hypothetical protein